MLIVLFSSEPMPQVDHSSISYRPFRKDFYRLHEEIRALSDAEVAAIRSDEEITVSGSAVPRPISAFRQAGFPEKLLRQITHAGFEV
jgi:hypothetical protein